MNQHIQTLKEHVYLAKRLGYDYTILYKVGSHILVIDALPCTHEIPVKGFWLLIAPHFKFLKDLKKELSTNS